MPLIQNTKYIFNKYDRNSYSPNCSTYTIFTEDEIFCIIVNNDEIKNTNIKKVAEDFYKKGKKHTSIRGGYIGNNLKDFDNFLSKYFKLK